MVMKNPGSFAGAYDRIRRTEIPTGKDVSAQSNSRPLNQFVETESIQPREVYDWRTGTRKIERMDVLTNAQANINREKIRPVTNGRGKPVVNQWGEPIDSMTSMAVPVPTIAGRVGRTKTGKKARRK